MAAELSGGCTIEVSSWLKSMPVAPEYHPTLAEFEDPIAYIFKIEKEASRYGICKIVPPVPSAPKKTVIANLNKSLIARSGGSDSVPTFTTRQQQIGFCPRKHRPVQKPVWQSGEKYTVAEFEAKARNFERNYLKKYVKKGLNALEVETLYWNAIVDKPFPVEYANDMPGSAFCTYKSRKKKNEAMRTVGDTRWNMRRVSRENLSLLRFMKEEIPGVTSPMVYLAMMFSWFAWHVEDHDLHSLNYMHLGAGKTWYGVPWEAAVAFEQVIREHGYGGEINPLVTFATLGEKVTVMSPEVLLSAGVPCCRLVQNAGEFVVTFPRAYHSGFSHGFNCGEAANIATPEWLTFAKEAAIRRAAINCAPMVSHFQLLYDLALSLCLRVPKSIATEPRSSRLKDRKKGGGDMLIKELFLQDMLQNNNMLHSLGKGSPVVLLPQNSLSHSIRSNASAGFQSTTKSRLFPGLYSPDLELKTMRNCTSDEIMQDRRQTIKPARQLNVNNRIIPSLFTSRDVPSVAPYKDHRGSEMKRTSHCEQGLFSCVTCGMLCFACVAIVQPTEAAGRYLMSADSDALKFLGIDDNDNNEVRISKPPDSDLPAALVLGKKETGLFNIPASADQIRSPTMGVVSDSKADKEPSSLGLLALAYGNSSDSENDNEIEADISDKGCGQSNSNNQEDGNACDNNIHSDDDSNAIANSGGHPIATSKDEDPQSLDCSDDLSNSLTHRFRLQKKSQDAITNSLFHRADAILSSSFATFGDTDVPLLTKSDEDSSRLHVFCLHHAMQVEKQLNRIGGANVFLICHPDYPELESQAKKVSEELESDCSWSDISFQEAAEEDEEIIRLALESENAIHGNGDWAVKMGINLFYSANLSRSPLYCKQMHYNYVIYNAFGRCSTSTEAKPDCEGGRAFGFGRQRKIVVAGKWCGKVWMSSQAHPLLLNKDPEEQEPDLPSISASARLKPLDMLSEASEIRRTRSKRKVNVKGSANMKETEKMGGFSLSNWRKHIKRKRGSVISKETNVDSENVGESADEREGEGEGEGSQSPKRETSVPKNSDDSSDEFQLNTKSVNGKRIRKAVLDPVKNLRSKKQFNSDDEDELQTKKEKETPEPLKYQRRSKKQFVEDDMEGGPSSRLRNRKTKPCKDTGPSRTSKPNPLVLKKQQKDKSKVKDDEAKHTCDKEGCTMSFASKQELTLHKKDICPVKECGKKFFNHKYLVQHQRVHVDDRPLKCPWKGCKMTFKWAWARTEHIRVHTGERPYVCTEAGCGQTFRFVSDFSRHKRKTGHAPKKARIR